MLRDNPFASATLRPAKQWPILGRIALLLGFWLFIGFALGTVLLLFPVRWWATLCRANGWAHSVESSGVAIIILVLVLVSFALANGAMKLFVRTDRPLVPSIFFSVVDRQIVTSVNP